MGILAWMQHLQKTRGVQAERYCADQGPGTTAIALHPAPLESRTYELQISQVFSFDIHADGWRVGGNSNLHTAGRFGLSTFQFPWKITVVSSWPSAGRRFPAGR